MRWVLAFILMILCSPSVEGQGLQTPGLGPEYDLWGHKYPMACRYDMSDVDIPIWRVPVEKMRPGYLGECVNCTSLTKAYILILNTLEDHGGKYGRKYLTEAIRHEKCHRKMWMIGLDIYWHPD